MPTVRLEVVVSWWFEPYVSCLVFCCVLFGTEPDWTKLERVLARALKFRPAKVEP